MVKIALKPYETLRIIIYHHVLKPMSTAAHFIDMDLVVACYFSFGNFTHLSVFNDFTLCPYIIPRYLIRFYIRRVAPILYSTW
jgi:hypothetical protein